MAKKAKTDSQKTKNFASGKGVVGNLDIPLDEIEADTEFNARKNYEGEDSEKKDSRQSIEDLAESIKREGLHQPILVRKGDDGRYSLVYGFRRYKAVQHLHEKHPKEEKYKQIKAQIWEGSDEDAYMVNLTENCARNDLLPWELADRCAFLADKYKRSGGEIAQRVGKSTGYVNNLIRISRNVHPEILKAWRESNKALNPDKMNAFAGMVDKDSKKPDHKRQISIWRATTADTDTTGANGANGANGTAANGTGGQAGKARKPSDSLIVKAIEALEAAKKAKKIDDERYKGMMAMYRFLVGKTHDIPGVFSPSKTGKKKATLPDGAEA